MLYDHIASVFNPGRLQELLKRAPGDANTREKLAKLVGCSQETLNAIEKGGYEPPLQLAYKLAAAFKVPLEYLLSDERASS
jgi:DNA-binding XRE family transcriptional regulator